MAPRVFFDTNILVYAFDDRFPAKQETARRVLAETPRQDIVVSVQVLEEFVATTTRKLRPPLSAEAAARVVRDLSRHTVVPVDITLILSAISRTVSDPVVFWDALILEAALAAGCERLYSEDFQHGRVFGGLRVVNPLLGEGGAPRGG